MHDLSPSEVKRRCRREGTAEARVEAMIRKGIRQGKGGTAKQPLENALGEVSPVEEWVAIEW